MIPLNPPLRIETKQAFARPATPDDAEALWRNLTSNPEVMRDLPMPLHTEVAHTKQFLENSPKLWEMGVLYRWVFVEKDSDEIFGMLELTPQLPRVEIGMVTSMTRTYARRHAWVRMLRALIKWLDEQPAVYRTFVCCAVGGQSASSMPKLGFELEATMRSFDARPNSGMTAGDSYLFARTRTPKPIPPESPIDKWMSEQIAASVNGMHSIPHNDT